MGQACDVCGKGPGKGNTVTHRGRAKYLGGVGVKTTGISVRRFKPNLRTVRVTTPNGTHKTVRICTQCIRSGAVTKTIRNALFKLPPLPGSEKAKPEAVAEAKAPKVTPEELRAKGYKVRKRNRKKDESEG